MLGGMSMEEHAMPAFRATPGPRSLIYSLRWFPRDFWRFPLVCNYPLRIHKGGRATFEIDGQASFIALPEMVEAYSARLSGDRTVITMMDGSRLRIGNGTVVGPGSRFNLGPDASVSIGSRCLLNENCTVYSRSSISIGDDCAISWGVRIMDTDFHVLVKEGERCNESSPVRIGDHVWIGSNATILKGVSIGDDAVIGASSVVTRDVPDGSVVAGNPARTIQEDTNWHWM